VSASTDCPAEPAPTAVLGEPPLVFCSDGAARWADGPAVVVESRRSDSREWADEVLARLRGAGQAHGQAIEGAVAIGAIGFRPGAPARAVLPQWTRRVPEGGLAAVLRAPAPQPPVLTVAEEPSSAHYASAVAEAVRRIRSGDVRKVVLGRWLDIVADRPLDARELVADLLRRHPGQHVFSVPLDDGAVLVGASPELLVSRRGTLVRSMPLAGSARRSADPVEDRARAHELLESAKDLEEHGYVVAALTDALGPLCASLDVAGKPTVIATDTMWHLATPIQGVLARDGAHAPSVLHLAQLLHPTPAVCGSPTPAARELIAQLEPVDRGYLTGAVGWVDAAGDGDWAVTIRAGVLHGSSLRLFAGAGIVAGSSPDSEVLETQGKLGTMLAAAGGR
jgi:isochorismate synthase